MPTIMAKVSRSRRICTSSFSAIARNRENEKPPFFIRGTGVQCTLSCASCMSEMNTSSSDGSTWVTVNASRGTVLDSAAAERGRIVRRDVQRGAERHDGLHAVRLAQLAPEERQRVLGIAAAGDDVGREPRMRDHLGRGALDQQAAIGEVRELVAALGFVHVMRADQYRHPFGGEIVDVLPEIAPRLRVDARGRLVEEQELRLVQEARGERQPLLPAARQRARELVAARRQPQALERSIHGVAPVRHGVHARDEVEVLGDRQVLVEAEALGHVADLALDGARHPGGCRSRASCPRLRRARAGRTASGWSSSCRCRWGRGSRRSARAARQSRSRPPPCGRRTAWSGDERRSP